MLISQAVNSRITALTLFVLLLASTMALAGKDNARKLSEDFKLNTEESVVSEFRQLTMAIREKLGEQAWLAIQAMALKAIEDRDFTHFGPLVNDVSCELRALFGVYVAERINSAGGLTEDDLNLSTLIYILSHGLTTEYGEDGFGAGDQNERAPLSLFLSELNVQLSQHRLDQLIKELERAVAYGSVMFARRLAAELNSDTGHALEAVFLTQCIFDSPDRRRPVLPHIGISSLALEFSRLRGIPLVIRTRLSNEATGAPSRGTVVTVYRHDGQRFTLVEPGVMGPDTPVLAVDAVTTRFGVGEEAPPPPADVERYLEELDLEAAWLSGSAAHHQFAGENKDAELTASPRSDLEAAWLSGAAAHHQFAGENADAELTSSPGSEPVVGPYQELVETAERIGTSSSNRSALFVDHCYVTTFEQAVQYAGRMGSQRQSPISLSHGLYYPASRSEYQAPVESLSSGQRNEFIAAHEVLLNGHQVFMDEFRVAGAGNNCGFTALGLERVAAIEGLVPQIRNNPEVAEMVREEVRAAFLRNELPRSMRAEAQVLFQQRGAQADTIDGVLADLRIQFGEQFADIDAAFTYMHGRPNIAAETLQHVNDLITERDGIEREINEHFYTPDALVRFVEEEYLNGPGMLSYIPDQRGTLYALAHINNIEVHIVENRDGHMQDTFYVPLRVIDPAANRIYLYHTGAIDEGTGRRYLNHFNLLVHHQPDEQANPSGQGTEPTQERNVLFSVHQAFLTYYAGGLDEVLPLRIQSLGNMSHVVLSKSQWLQASNQSLVLADDVAAGLANGETILIPYNLWGQHWVGVALERDADGQITVNYMDPENKPMPRELRVQLIAALSGYSHVHVAQIPVEQQRYNNCGPEVIENFVWYLTGNRATQEEAVPLHSWLLQQRLMPSARLDEKLGAQLKHYAETGVVFHTLQNAVDRGLAFLGLGWTN